MPPPVFKFDRFELDVGNYELRRAGQRITLQRVPMDLLIFLLERKGVLVTREEIAARVWNGDGLVDTQSGINTAIRKIRQALDDDGEQPRFIETVIGKGYRLVCEVDGEVETQAAEQKVIPAKQRPFWHVVSAVVGALVIGALAVLLLRHAMQKPEPMTIVPFTALAGLQSWPAFSADGNRVAFGWTGAAGDCSHIYVKAIAAPSPLQWTHGSQCEGSPSWSPDGRWLAFLTKERDRAIGLSVMPASGGNPRTLAALNGPANYRPAWTPDGQSLVVMHSDTADQPPGLFRVALDSGTMRRLTTPEPSSTGDWCPLYSPRGGLLAYLHNTGSRRLSSLYVVPVDGSGWLTGPSRRIETGTTGFTDFAWSSDGRSLIGSTPSGLVRVPLSGGIVQPLPFPDGSQPAIAARGDRMLYMRPLRDTDIFRLPGPGVSGAPAKLIASTRQEFAPQYSADGKRIVFVSDRTGADEIWVANSDGEDLRQITWFAGPSVGSPRWSPDGQWIAFDSTAETRPGIYLAALNGGAPRRITSGEISCVRPSWSRDQKWIYFGSNQGGGWNIWKIAPQGGLPVQVTQHGGREAFEAPGGEFLYYTKTSPAQGIWRISLKTGAETKFSDAGSQGKWAVGGGGIYYLKAPNELLFEGFSGTALPLFRRPVCKSDLASQTCSALRPTIAVLLSPLWCGPRTTCFWSSTFSDKVQLKKMATSPSPAKISFDEYLELERVARFKSEYRCGEVFAMAGGTPLHAELSVRMGILLSKLAGCRVFSSDLRVCAQSVNEGMYPDVSVACEELQYHDGRKDVILNPAMAVEVLSHSSRDYDVGMKASFYRSIPSLKALFLVDSERQYVQVQSRNAGAWTLSEFTENAQVVWSAGNYQITVGDIYAGIVL